jgi:hypothetical protein
MTTEHPAGFTSSNREKRIDDALRYYGLSVIIRTENEFNHIKKFLSDDVLYIDFVPQMATKLTSIVIWSDMKEFTTGSVGCAQSQKEEFIRLVEFNDFFKL